MQATLTDVFCFPPASHAAGGGIFVIVGATEIPEVPELEAARAAARTTAAVVVPEAPVLLIERSTIADNEADSLSANCPASAGGAYFLQFGGFGLGGSPFRVVNSTFSGNEADAGGGVVVDRGSGAIGIAFSASPHRRWPARRDAVAGARR